MSKLVNFELHAQARTQLGKSANRLLRRQAGMCPAIVYGGKQPAQAVQLEHRLLSLALENESFYSHILTLHIDNKPTKVVLKDLQRHPFKQVILHADFQRVEADDYISLQVPIKYLNETICPGVKQGGIINHHMVNVEVRCQAKDLPECVEVDLANLNLDQGIHLSELKLPAGVHIPSLQQGKEYDLPVVSVHGVASTAETSETAETKA